MAAVLESLFSFNPISLVAGAVVALSVFLMWLGIFYHTIWPERIDISTLLGEGDEMTMPEKMEISNSTLRQLANYLEKRQSKAKLEELDEMLAALGRPSPYTDVSAVYSQAVLSGLILALFAGVLITFLVAVLEFPVFAYIIVFVAGFFGYQIPFRDIKSRTEARRKGMIVELPSLMSQLLIAYNATNSLPSALIAVVSRPTPMSGYLFYELRKIVDDYTTAGESLPQALKKAEVRTRDVPIVSRALARLRNAEETGMPVNTALRALVQRSYQYLEYQLTATTQRNQTLALLPVAIAVLVVLLQVLIPFLTFSSNLGVR